MEVGYTKCIRPARTKDLNQGPKSRPARTRKQDQEQGQQLGCTGIKVNAILGVNAVYVPTIINYNFESAKYKYSANLYLEVCEAKVALIFKRLNNKYLFI